MESGEQRFIHFVIEAMCRECRYRLQLSIAEVTPMLRTLSATDSANLFRKQFGNLEACFKHRQVSRVFYLDSMIIKVLPDDRLQDAVSSGLLSADDFSRISQKRIELDTLQQEALKRAGFS
jgi:hypothetical protein